MFSKLIRRNDSAAAAVEPPPEEASVPAWENRLQTALGDDTALLLLATEAPSIDIKLAAVQALSGEDALRQAEREFRTHDRRVHRAAKQRYETQVRQREMRVQADDLIQAAAALVGEAMIPANRLVELDHAWRALDAGLLEDAQRTRFSGLQVSLAELLRERGERVRAIGRWCADAKQAAAQWDAACAAIADAALGPHELVATLGVASAQASAALAAMPAATAADTTDAIVVAGLERPLQTALENAPLIDARLKVLDELLQGILPPPPSPEEGAVSASVTPPATPLERWQAPAPIADPRLRQALDARFEAWLRSQDEARRKRQADRRQRADDKDKATHQAHLRTLTAAADGVDAALAAGHLADAEKHMAALQAASGNGEPGAPMRARIEALQAEVVRLKGWQHWGGGRVRDDLTEEAEALARSVVPVEGSRPAKVSLKQLEKSIEQLRARWKELDRLGGATSKALWQRFDGALKTAYQPVAAHLNRMNEARLENLAAREGLVATLDALKVDSSEAGDAPDWKEITRALAHFQTEWRKLGPLEHTVPHKKLAALTARMKASVARLEEPLQGVLHGAQAERVQFIVRARALSEHAQDRDIVAKIRDLQTQWQRHAKAQPLPRKAENALWADFKAATAAVMARREEVFNARNAELEVNRAAREALIGRLEELSEDTPPVEIKRILTAVEAEWRHAGEAPRNRAEKLESRFRAARETALRYIAGSAQRKWQATCDALVAKLMLCEEVEAGIPAALDEIVARWIVLPALPSRWEQALQSRFKAGAEATGSGSVAKTGATTAAEMDKLLLQLEAALDIPSPAAFQEARRSFKLLAMKHAMEGRRSLGPAATDIDAMAATAFGYKGIEAVQRQRLAAIVAALRVLGPGGSRG